MTLAELKTFTTAKLGITDADALAQAGEFIKARWKMIWNAQPWRQSRWQETVSVPADTQDVTLGAEFEFVTACRWKGEQELMPINDQTAFSLNPAGYDQSGPPAAFSQLAKTSAGLVRIRLHQIPNETQPLLVLGKRKCVELTSASDTPLIPGVDECLTAFAMGDLYQWIRQFSKAQACYNEANGLMEKMIEIERQQSAGISRLVPVEQQLESYNSVYDFC